MTHIHIISSWNSLVFSILNLSPLPGGSDGQESACNAGGQGSDWVGKIPWRRECNPLRYSCLANSMDRGAWRATDHRVTNWTQKWLTLSLSTYSHPIKVHLLSCQKAPLQWIFDSPETISVCFPKQHIFLQQLDTTMVHIFLISV